MADNTLLNVGTGGNRVVDLEISFSGDTAHLQGVALFGASGTEGAYTTGLINGDAANGIDVDVTRLPALPAGNNNIGDVDIASVPADPFGTNADAASTTGSISAKLRQLVATGIPITSLPALAAGANAIGKLAANSGVDIGDVDVLSVGTITPGTAATSLGKAEDAVAASGDVGVAVLAVRRDAASSGVSADGDYANLSVDANGALRVSGASGTTQYTEDTASVGAESLCLSGAVRQDSLASSTSADGDYAALKVSATGALYVNVAEGGITGLLEDAASAGGETGVMMLAVRRDSASSGVSSDGDFAALSVDSSGALRVVGSSGTTQYVEDAANVGGESLCLMGAVRRDAASSGVSADGDYATLSVDSSGALRVTGGGGGTQYQEDTAAANADTGTVALVVRQDTPASSTSADGDYTTFKSDSLGRLWVNGSGVTQPVSLAAGAASIGKAEDTASVDADVGVPAMAVRKATPANTSSADGDYEMLQMSAGRLWTSATIDAALPAGANAIGTVGVTSVPADPFGANADAASASGSISAKLRQIATNGIPITGTVTVGSHAVTNAGTFAVQESGTHVQVDDAAFTPATSKVLVGGYLADDASTDSVDEGDAGAARMTLNRKQISQPYESEANSWNYAAAAGGLVNTTGVTAKAAAGAGLRNYITGIQVINSHATISTEIVVRDGAAGTVLHRGWAQAAGGGYAAEFPVPLRGTANTLVEIAEVTATATTGVLVNLQGYVGA